VTLDDIRRDIAAALEDNKRATEGPWSCSALSSDRHCADYNVLRGLSWIEHNGRIARVIALGDQGHADASFIAHSRDREPRLARALQAVLDALDEEEKIHVPQKGERTHGDYFADRAEGARSAVSSIRAAIARRLEKS